MAQINTGDTAWLIVGSAFVMLMTFPGLALFYGGLAKKKDTLNTFAMSIVTYALISILWIVYGYSLAFNGDIHGFIGNFEKVLLKGVGINTPSGSIPEFIFAMFQLTFAAITVALASGALIERLKFSAWLLFSILWMTLVYAPVAHWVWGGGFLANDGALDFAGGTVVHINAGIAALVGTLILGKRKEPLLKPHNLTLVVIGTGLLWFGWFGFNAGSALAANGVACAAFINTNTAAAAAALTWLFVEWALTKKPTILGFCSGVVAGLVAITPAAGFVNLGGSILIGILATLVAYFAVAVVKTKLGYDDALDVFGIHGVAGMVGALLTGIFADPAIGGAKGLLYGNPLQLWIQIKAVAITIAYDAIVSLLIFGLINMLVGLRVADEIEIQGLDSTLHGEKAYNFE